MYVVESIKERDYSQWSRFFLAFIFISIGSYFFPRLAGYLVQKQIQDYNHAIRERTVEDYFNSRSKITVADAQNHLTNDLQLVDDSYLNNFFFIISDIGTIICSTAILLTIHWLLLVLTLVVVAGSLIVSQITSKPLDKATNELSNSNRKYFNLLENWLRGIGEIRRYLAGGKLLSTLRVGQKMLANSNISYQKQTQLVGLASSLFSNLFSLFLYLAAGILIQQGKIIFGTLISIGNFHYYVSGAIEDINLSIQQMKSVKKLNKSFEFSGHFTQVKQPSVDVKPAGIKLKNIGYWYENNSLVYPNLDIKPGEKILLTGSNGRGKSTLLDIIAGEKTDFKGEVVFTSELGFERQYTKVNYMTQKAKIFPGSYLDNITMYDEKFENEAHKVIESIGLSNMLISGGNSMSGGQEQIISLLRYAIHPANVLLIDEGLSGVDDVNKEKLLKYLRDLPVTFILVEHNLNQRLKAYFDREIKI